MKLIDASVSYQKIGSVGLSSLILAKKAVCFGAWVKLEDENENIRIFRIVGADEFNPTNNGFN